MYKNRMLWADVDIYLRDSAWRNCTDGIVLKYFHTKGGLSYSLGFTASGPGVSISPTSEQWSLAVTGNYSH